MSVLHKSNRNYFKYMKCTQITCVARSEERCMKSCQNKDLNSTKNSSLSFTYGNTIREMCELLHATFHLI